MQTTRPRLLDALFLIFIFGFLYTYMLSSRPLFTPDEGRYAEIAREMVTTKDYLTPHLNGIKYFEKPPLFYWLTASAIKLNGANIVSVRLVNILFSLLGIVLTYVTTARLYTRQTGLFAAFILGTSLLYFIMGRMVTLDLPVTVFLSGALFAFILGCNTQRLPERRRYFVTAAVSAALAVLTKGLIGIVLPGLVACVWLTLTKEWRQIKTMFIPLALFVFFVVALPWHALVYLKNPEFFHFYFIEQHFLRYTHEGVGHYQPIWFFSVIIIAGFFPWFVFLIQTFYTHIKHYLHDKKAHQNTLFFLLWFVVVFTFFSFSKSKLIPYILPCMPPLAILTAHYFILSTKEKFTLGVKIGFLMLTIVSALLFYYFKHLSEIKTGTLAFAFLQLRIAFLLFFVTNLITLFILWWRNQIALFFTFLCVIALLAGIQPTLILLDTRTVKPLADIILAKQQPNDTVVSYNQYYQDLPFYLQQTVTVLNWQNELTFGMAHQNNHDWMIADAAFWQTWRSGKRVFAILNLDDFKDFARKNPKQAIYILGNTMTNVLVSNQP